MYPNPQDVLPLAERPSYEWYRKQAKDLLKAGRSSPGEVHAWAAGLVGADQDRREVRQLAEFALRHLTADRSTPASLSDAQFVVARAFGFASWPAFSSHLRALEREASPQSRFEAAADAIVSGNVAALRALLRENPGLIRTRSTRDHHATLLHYVAANGVENYRQKTPPNAPEVARLLLDEGAEVDAHADVYGGGSTTLGLVATSIHPQRAGVQHELLDVLLAHGARMDWPHPAGNRHPLVTGCLANGQPDAAAHLADQGAPLDFEGACGIGRVSAVKEFLIAPDGIRVPQQLALGLAYACGYGHAGVVALLLDSGVSPDLELSLYGSGHTALHIAAYHAHVEVVRLLLAHGARVDVADRSWSTTALLWALHGRRERGGDPGAYRETVALLVAAGAAVPDDVSLE